MKKVYSVLVAVLLTFLTIPLGAVPSYAARTIKIGVLFPLTGGAASAGSQLRAGAQLAAEVANNKMPGIDMAMAKRAGITSLGGAKIKLIFVDHEGDPTLGAALAKKLIKDDHVVGLLGCYQSSVTKAVSNIAEEYGVPMINSTSTSPALTRRGLKWFWRTTPNDATFVQDLFTFLQGLSAGKVKGVPPVPKKQIVTLASACENTEWGTEVSATIRKLAPHYGFKVAKSILYSHSSPDLSSEVASLKDSGAHVLLFAGYGADSILMMRTLQAQRVPAKIIWGDDSGFVAPEFKATLGDNILGFLTRSVFTPKVAEVKKVAGEINALYREKTGHSLNGQSARAFTGVQAWVDILQKAGSTNPKAIQRAANTIMIPGNQLVVPWAGIKFSSAKNDKGQNIMGSGIIGQYQKDKAGKIVLQIVYPFNMATAKMIYPYKRF